MRSTISATEAGRRFSDLLSRIRYRGEEFIVVRGGEPVCRMSPVGPARCTGRQLKDILAALPRPDRGYLDTVEALQRSQPKTPEPAWDS